MGNHHRRWGGSDGQGPDVVEMGVLALYCRLGDRFILRVLTAHADMQNSPFTATGAGFLECVSDRHHEHRLTDRMFQGRVDLSRGADNAKY
jgi:hypothetical protein